jgi:radical SAM protein with 4Fe4S-binding SPASM domain
MDEKIKKSKFISLIQLSTNYFCISHALMQEQIFGDYWLKKIFNELSKGISYDKLCVLLDNIFPQNESKVILNFFKNKDFFGKKNETIFGYISTSQNSNKKDYRLLRILLTDVCNLNCRYCKVMPNIKTCCHKATDKDDLRTTINLFLKNSKASHPKVIHITGGEPLIFWDKVKYIVKFINDNKRKREQLMIVLGTNGLLVNQEKVNFIKKHNIKVIVSLDGRERTHNELRKLNNNNGSYYYVDKALMLLKKFNIDLGVSMVIGKHNFKTLNEEIDYIVHKYKPISLGVNYMKPPTREDVKFPYLINPKEYVNSIYSAYKIYRNIGLYFELVYRRLVPFVEQKFRYSDCGATAGATINLDAQGRIGPCKSFLVLGMLSEKIQDTNQKEYINGMAFMKRSPIYLNQCHGCEAIGICGNGCAYEAWISNGNPISIDQQACSYTKLFFKEFINDLFNIIKHRLDNKTFHVPTKQERRKLYGEIKIDKLNLNSSIGHETEFE